MFIIVDVVQNRAEGLPYKELKAQYSKGKSTVT